jgi:DnaJ like chaperone protein
MAMQWTGKVVGGLLGMLTAGPLGAFVGVILGHQFDANAPDMRQRPRLDAGAVGDLFFRTTFRVMGHIAKADGRVSEQEIEAARAVMSELRLSPVQVRAAIDEYTLGKRPGFGFDNALDELTQACAGHPELLRVFVEIQMRAALGGNNLGVPARRLMQRLASRVGMSLIDLAHIEAVLRIRNGGFTQGAARHGRALELEEAYRVLEVSADAGKDDIVKAYRRQLSRHHPDKLKANGLPESMIEHAKQRTQQIIQAYDVIRERRGI